MIQKCKITLRNKEIIVAIYDKKEIQFTNTGIKTDYVYVKKEENKYTIVSELEFNDESEAKEAELAVEVAKKSLRSNTKRSNKYRS